MRNEFKFLLLIVFFVSKQLILAGNLSDENSFRICTYNIRGDLPNDGINSWKYRKDSLCKIIKVNNFDIICMQEVLANQLDDIVERTEFSFVGVEGLYNPILFNSKRFEPLQWDMFWLSETMEPHVVGWDGKYERYCTWVKFWDKYAKKSFYVFNTHLDHKGKLAQKEGAALVVKQSLIFAKDLPVFITGDMNSYETAEAYQEFVKEYNDSYKVAEFIVGPVGTAHNFGQVEPVRIDYIFTNKAVKINGYYVEDEQYENGFYPSDHFAVFIDCVLK